MVREIESAMAARAAPGDAEFVREDAKREMIK
jgi:hypothetical protein